MMKFRQNKLSAGKVNTRQKKTVTFSDLVQASQPTISSALIGAKFPTVPVFGGHVGISSVPRQVLRRILKRPFDFHLLVVGESGVGKSSVIKALYQNQAKEKRDNSVKSTDQFEIQKVTIAGDAMDVNFLIAEAPGFGDLDSSDVFNKIESYISSHLDSYFEAELSVNQSNISDTRVGACLYFLNHSGHGVKTRDMELLKRLHKLVTIVPVIGKADTCTRQEVDVFKQQILAKLSQNKISIQAGTFAVVGPNVITVEKGRRLRGRRYPWGFVDIENREHCDFLALEALLFTPCIYKLKCETVDVLYENYRTNKLKEISEPDGTEELDKNPFLVLETEHVTEHKLITEREKILIEKFETKVKGKKKLLLEHNNDFELSVLKERMEIAEETQNIQKERKDLEEEIQLWEDKMFHLSNQAKSSKRKTLNLAFGAFKKKHTRNLSNSSNL